MSGVSVRSMHGATLPEAHAGEGGTVDVPRRKDPLPEKVAGRYTEPSDSPGIPMAVPKSQSSTSTLRVSCSASRPANAAVGVSVAQ